MIYILDHRLEGLPVHTQQVYVVGENLQLPHLQFSGPRQSFGPLSVQQCRRQYDSTPRVCSCLPVCSLSQCPPKSSWAPLQQQDELVDQRAPEAKQVEAALIGSPFLNVRSRADAVESTCVHHPSTHSPHFTSFLVFEKHSISCGAIRGVTSPPP